MLVIAVILFLTALLGTMICIRSVITVARLKHLFDEPSEERKIHIYRTPNLGGVGIYCAFLFSVALVIPNQILPSSFNFKNTSSTFFQHDPLGG